MLLCVIGDAMKKRINRQGILRKRSATILAIFSFIGLMLIGRLFYIQIIDHDRYVQRLYAQANGVETLYSPRGTIYDRNGKKLAFSAMVKSFYCDPQMIKGDRQVIAKALAPLLKENAEKIEKKLNADSSFVWLARLMDPEDSDKVEALLKENKWQVGFGFVHESRRYYPNGPLLANVLGFVGIDDIGLSGMEKSMEPYIGGEKSQYKVITDAKGNPILRSSVNQKEPEEKRSVYLTIDENIQFYAERALDRAMASTKAQGGIIIVMDPKNGDILALCNRPTYDPNKFNEFPDDSFKNRSVVDVYEPGSTFKPIIAAAALASGSYTTDIVWTDPGAVWASGHAIRNWDDSSYGNVRMVDIIKYSLNTGCAHIGLLMGAENLTKYARAFGFGKETGIELPGEASGILFQEKDMKDIDIATMSIGQGIAVTPLQMVQAYSALANGGQMVKPHILAAIRNPDGSDYKTYHSETAGEPVDKEVADQVKDMMEKEISEGGGNKAKVPGYHMGGKTGTAQKINTISGGYLKNEHIASFCGFGPTEDPRAVCLVVLDNPRGVYYGGQVAAPVFKEVMEHIMRYLKIPALEEKHTGGHGVDHRRNLPRVPGNDVKEFRLPNFYGSSMRDVGEWLSDAGLGFRPEGTGTADRQIPRPGVIVKKGDAVKVYFSP